MRIKKGVLIVFITIAALCSMTGFAFGADSLYIDSSGKVGIGTTAPGAKLQVNSGTSNTVAIFTSTDNNANIKIADSNGFVTIGDNSDGSLSFSTNSVSDAMLLKDNGNVGIGLTNPVQKLQVAGNVAPGTDDAYEFGSSTLRWREIFAKEGTINTSDERHKDNMRDIPLGLNFINQLRPIAYKWKDYYAPEVKETKTIERQKTKRVTKEVKEKAVELVNGKYVQKNITRINEVEEPVSEEHPLYDENGSKVGTHRIPVMETVDEEVIVQKERNETFTRTHYGFSAQQVKATLDSFGVDFDGIVYHEENDTYGIRMSEFVPILMKAVQELKTEVDQLKAELSKLK